MIEKFGYKGEWWLPDKPGEKIPGTLSFTPNEGAVLDLMGTFKDIQDLNKTLEPEIILGISPKAELITLNKCFETKFDLSLPGSATSSFYANIVFIGAHFLKKEDIRFKRVSVHYSNLDEWVNISGFDIQSLFDKKEVVIKYKLPDPIQATTGEDYGIFIDFRANGPMHSRVQKEANIKQKTYVRIEPAEEKSFEEYLKIMYHIQNFLTLAITKPVYPLAIEGIMETNETPEEKNKTYNPPVEVFYQLSDFPNESKLLMPYDMLFTLADIHDSLNTFLQNWLGKAELLEPVYSLYFGTLYNPHMYLQHMFLSIMQAIESYHSRTMNNLELPEGEHEKRITEILDIVPEIHRNWLKNKLTYSNELNLRSRLKEFLKHLSDFSQKIIPDSDAFIQKVVSTRHYLTHYDLKLKDQSASGEELYHLTRKLKILLEICLLKELGFSLENITSLISRNTKYRQLFKKMNN